MIADDRLHEAAGKLSAVPANRKEGRHTYHPLEQLAPAEITEVTEGIKKSHPNDLLRFKFVSLLEPRKAQLVPFLTAAREKKSLPFVPRVANVLYSSNVGEDMEWFELLWSLDEHKSVSKVKLTSEFKPQGDPDEVLDLETIIYQDEKFKEAVKKFKLPAGSRIQADTWSYGSDSASAIPRLITYMVYFLPPNADKDSNHYAYPLPICPVVDTATRKVLHVIEAPTGGVGDGKKDTLNREDPIGHLRKNEWVADLMDIPPRTDLKPIHITQPEGPSFTIDGNRIRWQKWDFVLTFNYREGIVLHDIHYDNRSVFYRLALSEMTVPYGDPREPYHRKQAFDSGDCGLGLCANQLDLGCDCLGLIKYFDGHIVAPDGSPRIMKNVICMHEVDDGILWKHTHYRTDTAAVTRSRHLVLQTICTVSNYEYIWIWKFDLAGGIHFETRATGILSTSYIDAGKQSEWGAVVNPGVLAPNHQHVFNIRIDPAIDGHSNTVVQEDSYAIPYSEENPHGTAWKIRKTPITQEGVADANPQSNRIFKIINKSKLNPVSGRPVGYKFTPNPGALMFAQPDSIARKRAEFGGHHIYVTKYRDDELYPSGNYTYQSSGNAKGLESDMIKRGDNVENDDVVLWHSFCLTHNPRIEDWPVMPYEKLEISFKPADFFEYNPSMDVPRSRQEVNKSTLYNGLTESCCR